MFSFDKVKMVTYVTPNKGIQELTVSVTVNCLLIDLFDIVE